MKRLIITLAAFAAMGGALVRADEYVPKSISYAEALDVLRDPPAALERVRQMKNVEALHFIAVAARAASLPMKAGPDRKFNDMMNELSLAAVGRLFQIDTRESREAIELCRDEVEAYDDAVGLIFDEWEKEAEAARNKFVKETVDGVEWTYKADRECDYVTLAARTEHRIFPEGSCSNKEDAVFAVYALTAVPAIDQSHSGVLRIPERLGGKEVREVSDLAFTCCTGITEVVIPPTVKAVGASAFSACTSLTNIVVAAENERYSSIDGLLYNKDGTELVLCPPGRSEAKLRPGLRVIGGGAFAHNEVLRELTIPESVERIGRDALAANENVRFKFLGKPPSGVDMSFGSLFDKTDPSTAIEYPAECKMKWNLALRRIRRFATEKKRLVYATPQSPKRDTIERMRGITIPSVDFKPPMKFGEAIDYLRQAAKDFDSPELPYENRGFDIDYFLSDESADPVVTKFRAHDISLYDALKLLCLDVDCPFEVSVDGIVVFRQLSLAELVELECAKNAKTEENTRETIMRMKEMKIPAIRYRRSVRPCKLSEAVEIMRETSADFDEPVEPLEKRGFNIVLRLDGASDPEISDFSADDLSEFSVMSFYDALKLVCESAGYTFDVEGNVVVVRRMKDETSKFDNRVVHARMLFVSVSNDVLKACGYDGYVRRGDARGLWEALLARQAVKRQNLRSELCLCTPFGIELGLTTEFVYPTNYNIHLNGVAQDPVIDLDRFESVPRIAPAIVENDGHRHRNILCEIYVDDVVGGVKWCSVFMATPCKLVVIATPSATDSAKTDLVFFDAAFVADDSGTLYRKLKRSSRKGKSAVGAGVRADRQNDGATTRCLTH